MNIHSSITLKHRKIKNGNQEGILCKESRKFIVKSQKGLMTKSLITIWNLNCQ